LQSTQREERHKEKTSHSIDDHRLPTAQEIRPPSCPQPFERRDRYASVGSSPAFGRTTNRQNLMDRLSRRGHYAQAAQHQLHGGSAQTSQGGSPTASSPELGGASTAGLARVMGSSYDIGGGARGAAGDGGSGSYDDDDYELSGPPIELSSTPRRATTRSSSPSVTIPGALCMPIRFYMRFRCSVNLFYMICAMC
jgi:hypothetical protein